MPNRHMEAIVLTAKSFFAKPTATAFFAAFYAVFAYLFQVSEPEYLITIFILIVLDTVTGLRASKVEGKPITSRRMFGLVSKVIYYSSAIILVSQIQHSLRLTDPALESGAILVQNALIFWIIGMETKSILENLSRIRSLPEWLERRLEALFNLSQKLEPIDKEK